MKQNIFVFFVLLISGIHIFAQDTNDYNFINGNKSDSLVKNLPAELTAKTIIENYVNAIGGKENIIKVKDRTITLTGLMQGITLNLTLYQKYPNKLLQVVNAGGMEIKVIFNGYQGITISPMGKQELSGDMHEEIKIYADIKADLNYSEAGIKATLSGIEKIEGKDVYKISMQLPCGKRYFEYYDLKSSLKVRQVKTISSPIEEINQTSDFSDYQVVDGLKYPFKIKQIMGFQYIEVTVTAIKVNQNLDDKLFELEK